MDERHQHFEIPRLRDLARHAIPHIVEATLVPLALFYGFLWLVGVWGAILAALGWSYVAVARRLLTGRRIPGLLVLATVGVTARTLLALASRSAFLYFLQPSLVTGIVGGVFLLSVPAGRPLAQRLAHDFVPLPPALVRRPAIQRVFVRITLLWALVNLINAAGAIGLLLSQPVATYVAAKTAMSWVVTGGGVALSAWLFKRTVRLQPALVPSAEAVRLPVAELLSAAPSATA
jgi:intracellular septation protein A